MRPYISRVVDSSKQAITSLQKTVSNLSWNTLTGKPDTFPPSTHTHSRSQILDFPSSLPANGGNADTVDGLHGYQLGTFASNGNSHGTGFPLMCQHNRDSDGMFKLYVEGQTTKVDFATNADKVDGKHFNEFVQMPSARMSINDLNNANYPYAYRSSISNGTQIGLPSAGWYHIDYFRHLDNNGYGHQVAYPLNHDGAVYHRGSGGTHWGVWKTMGGGDYVGKQLISLPTFTFSDRNSTFTYNNSKGGMLKLMSTFSRQNLGNSSLLSTLVVDGVPIASNAYFGALFQSISSNESYYTHELIVPFEHTVSLSVSLAVNRSIDLSAKAYINK